MNVKHYRKTKYTVWRQCYSFAKHGRRVWERDKEVTIQDSFNSRGSEVLDLDRYEEKE